MTEPTITDRELDAFMRDITEQELMFIVFDSKRWTANSCRVADGVRIALQRFIERRGPNELP